MKRIALSPLCSLQMDWLSGGICTAFFPRPARSTQLWESVCPKGSTLWRRIRDNSIGKIVLHSFDSDFRTCRAPSSFVTRRNRQEPIHRAHRITGSPCLVMRHSQQSRRRASAAAARPASRRLRVAAPASRTPTNSSLSKSSRALAQLFIAFL